MPRQTNEPPREWLEDHFVHDGTVTYCSECKMIPFAFIGHFCTGIEARMGGFAADKITVPYRWEDVQPVGNDDRPGDWALVYVGEGR